MVTGLLRGGRISEKEFSGTLNQEATSFNESRSYDQNEGRETTQNLSKASGRNEGRLNQRLSRKRRCSHPETRQEGKNQKKSITATNLLQREKGDQEGTRTAGSK